jgi:hypothetical protein
MMTNTRKFGLLLLAVACLVISVATMLAIVVLRNQASLVTNGVWTRGGIITLSSAWLLVAARPHHAGLDQSLPPITRT